MRPPYVLFVLLKVVIEHGQGALQSINALRVNARSYAGKFFKIKGHKTLPHTPLYKRRKTKYYNIGCGARAAHPYT